MEISIKNLSTGEQFSFDEYNFVLNTHNLDSFQVQHNTSRTIKQVGEYIQSTNVNSRPVNFIGYILGQSPLDLEQKKNLLLNITSPFSDIEILANKKYRIAGKCLSPVKWGNGWENNNNQFVKFSLDLICPNTLWYDINKTRVDLSPFVNSFHFPISITKGFSFGHREPAKLTPIYNPVNVSLPLEIIITCTGNVTNPVISRIEGNQQFIINDTLTPADTVIINTQFGKKGITKNGVNIIGKVDLLNSHWLMLIPGLNTFGFSCEDEKKLDNLNMVINYNQAYWGITEC